MRAQDFGSHLHRYSTLLKEAGADDTAVAVEAFAKLFAAQTTLTTDAFLKFAGRIQCTNSTSPQLNDVSASLERLKKFVGCIAKKGFVTDLDRVIAFLSTRRTLSLSGFVNAVITAQQTPLIVPPVQIDNELVEAYVDAVEKSYRDKTRFNEVYSELSERGRVPEAVVRLVADRFSSVVTSKMKKGDALKQIKKLHTDYIRHSLKTKALEKAA